MVSRCEMRFRIRFSLFVLTALTTFTVGVLVASRQQKLVSPSHVLTALPQLRELAAWQVLLSFQDRDLNRLDFESASVLRQAIEATTGKAVPDNAASFFRPRVFHRLLNTQGEPRYLLVEYAPLMIIPGNSYLRINVFGAGGRLLNTEVFSARRTILTSIEIRQMRALHHELLVVDTDYCLGGNKTREFYALVGNRITPVYVEQDGRFDATETTVAPRMERSVAEWETALNSDDDVEALSSLLWLGAHHWTGRPMHYVENEGLKVSTMLAREDVRARLRALSQSANPWIKTAARSILNPNETFRRM